MITSMTRRISLWWRFKQLDRTYQPLLEKAMAFENRDALLKLEEQYWYQTACLLEERRELRKAQAMGVTSMTAPPCGTGNGHSAPGSPSPRGRFGSERDITYRHQNAAWRLVGLILGSVVLVGIVWWALVVNPGTKIVTLPWLF